MDASPIEIGVNKRYSHMCGVFIKEINKVSQKKFTVSGLHRQDGDSPQKRRWMSKELS